MCTSVFLKRGVTTRGDGELHSGKQSWPRRWTHHTRHRSSPAGSRGVDLLPTVCADKNQRLIFLISTTEYVKVSARRSYIGAHRENRPKRCVKFDRNQFSAGLVFFCFFSCDFVGVRTRKHSHFSFLKSLHVICSTSKNRIDGGKFKTSDIWESCFKKNKQTKNKVAAEFIFLLTATADLCLFCISKSSHMF